MPEAFTISKERRIPSNLNHKSDIFLFFLIQDSSYNFFIIQARSVNIIYRFNFIQNVLF